MKQLHVADAIPATRATDDAGFVAGAEALILGVLVFVLGTLIVVNGWAVLDARFATSAAAREAVRAVVETEPGASDGALMARAAHAAQRAFDAHGYAGDAVSVVPESPLTQDRCAPVRLRAQAEVRVALVPGFGARRTYTVASTHQEVVDPYRSGLPGGVRCGF